MGTPAAPGLVASRVRKWFTTFKPVKSLPGQGLSKPNYSDMCNSSSPQRTWEPDGHRCALQLRRPL